ncbi:MRC2 protein, partial [Amia calva]|nr:MRC2 protein [Amia calva]
TANATQRYTFVNLEKSWPQAQQHCRERNSDLATIHSLNENDAVRERAQGSVSWIGLFNEPWQWSDGGNSVFRQWKAGKPDYYHDENCVCIDNIQSDGDWDDCLCSTEMAFYCCSGNSSVSISVRCEAVLEEMTWSTAQSYCRAQAKDVPTIYNAEEIQQMLEINCTEMCTRWIGMYKGKQNWLWTNGERVSYANWMTSQFCAVIDVTGYWMDVRCFESYSLICYTGSQRLLSAVSLFLDVSQRYTLIKESKTWLAAQDYCREKHTDLVTIQSDSENDAVRKRAGGIVAWIGLFNDPWKWSDGSNSAFRDWAVNQPNNYNRNDKCVHVLVNNAEKGKMNDYTCSVKYPFICYEGLCSVPSCHSKQYHFVAAAKSWIDAQSYCRETYTDLATAENMAEITQLLDLASGNKELGAWIGMYRDEDNWQWSNGEQVAFYNWKRNLFFCTKVNEDGTWEDAVCNEGHPFVCYTDAANAAQRYTFVNLNKTWPQTQQYCRERNSDLATIHSLMENDAVKERTQGSVYWIGLFNEPWQWSDGGNSVFRQWKAGKPDNYYHNEDCVCIDNIQSDGDWDDYPCSTNLTFYCCSGNSSVSISVRCEAVLEEMTWSTAQSYCRAQAKDLPTIYNAEEIQQLLEINCTDMCTRWIGMYKGKQNWLWTNGERVSYANWMTSQFCAVIDVTGYWMDVRCFESYSFICYTVTSDVSQRYTLIKESKTWLAAQDYCQEKHTDLVTIQSDSENDAVRKRAGGIVAWIGLFNDPWKWSDGSNSAFQNWAVNQPNNYNGNDKCVHVLVNNAEKGKINDYICSVKYPFICYEGEFSCAPKYTK